MSSIPPVPPTLRRPSAVVFDSDPVAQTALASLLRALDWEVRVASDGEQGLALLDERACNVVLTGWNMMGTSGLEVCARIRQRVWSARPFVIVTTGKDSSELWRALAAGADDVLRKPFERREVETRVALARFVTEASTRLSLTEAVTEAMLAPAGKLVMRQGEVLARLMFRAGRIAWVSVSPSPRRFADHLATELGVEEPLLHEVLAESKVTGVPFDELIETWHLAEHDALRQCLRSWLAYQLGQVREMPSPSVLFVPLPPGGLGVTFQGFLVEDIAPWLCARKPLTQSTIPPSAKSDTTVECASKAMRIDGALAAFVLAVRDGTCLAQKGDRTHLEVSWSLARALQMMPPGADILLTSPPCHYVARSLEHDPELLLVVVVDIAVTTSGHARLQAARIASQPRGAA